MNPPYKCIMVVEDDSNVAVLLKHVLEKKGYLVFVAENGKEALAKLDALNDLHRPCLILCDLHMPVMDGWVFVEAVGKRNKGVPIPLVIHSAEAKTPEGYPSLRKPATIDAFNEGSSGALR